MRPTERDRAGLGHAPGLQDRQADLLAVAPPTAPWARPSRRTGSPRSDESVAALELGEHAHPDRRHAGGDRDLLGLDQLGDRRRRAGRARASRASAPAITAAWARPQALAWNIGTTGRIVSRSRDAERCRRSSRPSSAGTSSGASRRRPSGCRWCRSCNTSPRPGSRRRRGTRPARRRRAAPRSRRMRGRRRGIVARAVVHHHDVLDGLEAVEQRPQQPEQRPVDEDRPRPRRG